MNSRKHRFYRVLLNVEILMDEKPPNDFDLSDVAQWISEEGRSEKFISHSTLTSRTIENITPSEIIAICSEGGLRPEFFELDEDGNDLFLEDDKWEDYYEEGGTSQIYRRREPFQER